MSSGSSTFLLSKPSFRGCFQVSHIVGWHEGEISQKTGFMEKTIHLKRVSGYKVTLYFLI